MSYLIGQILFCLLVAVIIGVIVGWFLKSLCCTKGDDSEFLSELNHYKARINQLERENQNFKSSFQSFESNANNLNLQLEKLIKERDQFKERAYDIEASASSKGVGESDVIKDAYDIEEIEGIGQGIGKRLRSIDIKTTADLLARSGAPSERELISKTAKVEDFVVNKWISMADLIRVPGVRGQFSELLEASGIESIKQLSQQDTQALTEKMIEVNLREHRTRVNPKETMVSEWIVSAKKLA